MQTYKSLKSLSLVFSRSDSSKSCWISSPSHVNENPRRGRWCYSLGEGWADWVSSYYRQNGMGSYELQGKNTIWNRRWWRNSWKDLTPTTEWGCLYQFLFEKIEIVVTDIASLYKASITICIYTFWYGWIHSELSVFWQ